jgi:D-proline reductase (dithiol) PrdB
VGDLSEFSLSVQLFLRAYRWREIDPVPWTTLRKPLSECRIALVSTAGFVLDHQAPFDSSIKGGDTSFREIPNDANLSDLIDTHKSESFDHRGIRQDPNLAFPLDRMRELETAGRIGSLNRRHFSFMGSITAPGRLVAEAAPETARRLLEDRVDAALLVPV